MNGVKRWLVRDWIDRRVRVERERGRETRKQKFC
jgi:hypothetical protein